MVSVFRTNISNREIAEGIMKLLHDAFPGSRITFDLDDCDKILRMEYNADVEKQIPLKLDQLGYYCEAL